MSADEVFDDWLRTETGRDAVHEPTETSPPPDPSFGAAGAYMFGQQPAGATDAGFRGALLDAVDQAKGSSPLWR